MHYSLGKNALEENVVLDACGNIVATCPCKLDATRIAGALNTESLIKEHLMHAVNDDPVLTARLLETKAPIHQQVLMIISAIRN